MTLRSLILVLLLAIAATSAAAQQQICRPFVGTESGITLTGHGYAKYLPVTAKRITDTPADGYAAHHMATQALMFVSAHAIRYRTDGVNPTASSGVLLPAGTVLRWSIYEFPALREMRFIEAESGAEVTFSYCW